VDDVAKILGFLIILYRAAVGFLYRLGIASPLMLGYCLVGLALVLMLYRHRRQYYISQDVNGEFAASYSLVARRATVAFVLRWLTFILGLFAAVILSRNYLPEMFFAAFNFLLP
jgi:hypothetical protein